MAVRSLHAGHSGRSGKAPESIQLLFATFIAGVVPAPGEAGQTLSSNDEYQTLL
jgi:acyl-CoA synthetase (AMP-forming)/AMP-acid ligase II